MPILSQRHAYPQYSSRPASGSELRGMLGLPERGHLPVEGMETKIVQGYRVTVLSEAEVASFRPRRPHRIHVCCKGCGRLIPAGRLNQHETACLGV